MCRRRRDRRQFATITPDTHTRTHARTSARFLNTRVTLGAQIAHSSAHTSWAGQAVHSSASRSRIHVEARAHASTRARKPTNLRDSRTNQLIRRRRRSPADRLIVRLLLRAPAIGPAWRARSWCCWRAPSC